MEEVDCAAGGEGVVLQGGAGVAEPRNSKLVLQLFDCLSVQVAGSFELERLRATHGFEVQQQAVLKPGVQGDSAQILHASDGKVDLTAHKLGHLVRPYPWEHLLPAAVS